MFATRSRVAGGLLAVGTAGTVLVPLAAPAQAAETHLAAGMTRTAAFPHARGHADYEAEHGLQHFDVELHGVGRLHGKLLTVRVHGTFVGRMRVSAEGEARLERSSGLPRMSAGDAVRVRTQGGQLVSRGTLHFI
jgi:hypothetical protein